MAAIMAMGALALAFSCLWSPFERIDLYFVVLAACTIGLGSRVSVRIPRFKSHISVSDTFIFMTLLLYGAELAIILSAVEAFFSARRFCSKLSTVLFNAATMAVSTTVVVFALNALSLYPDNRLVGSRDQMQQFLIALSVIAIVQFAANTTLAAVYDALSAAHPFWETWKHKYVWTFFTYFAGSFAAGGIVLLANYAGLSVIVAALPLILLLSYSYRVSLKNIELSATQAEQANEYASVLEKQSIALRESEQRFRSAFNYAPIGIGLVSPAGKWLKVNRALSNILGYSADELREMDYQDVMFPEDLGSTLVKIHEVKTGKMSNCQMEQRYLHKSGRTVWTSWGVSAAGDADSENSNLIFQIQDITGKKIAEEKLQHEATHDALTGLPNRAYFMSRLELALTKTRRDERYQLCVLFIDLDRFKYVNDNLGHIVGDQLLIAISERLKQCLRPPDIVARLGGDEFTILIEGRYYQERITGIADRIQAKFTEPFDLSGNIVYSSASIGILQASERHKTPEDMMRDADTAMYQAKRAGKARYEVFDEKMHIAAREIMQLETDLRKAIENEELSIAYQPMFSIETGRMTGVEALTRWTHPERGPIPVNTFINLAEEIGVIDTLGEYILRRACREIGSVYRDIPDESRRTLSVNLSSRQFGQPTLVQKIQNILDETRFPADLLKLEITESICFQYQEKAIEMLHHIRSLGIEIDIDDFGTGYSNLSYLSRLPISTLKIDRSFIMHITNEGANTEIVKAIISMAGNLGMKTVAEGIETRRQLELLKSMRCDGGQGFLFAKPMDAANLHIFLSDGAEHAIPAPQFDDVPVLATVQ